MPAIPTRRGRGRGARGGRGGRGHGASRHYAGGGNQPRAATTPDAFAVRTLINSMLMGGIIGKKGVTVKEYRERSGCTISISKSVPGVLERMMTFRGPGDKVTNAMHMIISNIAAQHRRFHDTDSKSTPPEETPVSAPPTESPEEGEGPPERSEASGVESMVHSSSGEIGGRASDEEVEPMEGGGSTTFEFCLLVDNADVGSVIGKKGAEIKNIREVSGAQIKISMDVRPGTVEKSILIHGTETQLLDGVSMIVRALAAHHDRKCQFDGHSKKTSPKMNPKKPSFQHRAPPTMQLPYQTPYYLRTPRPSAPHFQNSYYMSTPKTGGSLGTPGSKNTRGKDTKGNDNDLLLSQFGISERGSNELDISEEMAQDEQLGGSESIEVTFDEVLVDDPDFEEKLKDIIQNLSPDRTSSQADKEIDGTENRGPDIDAQAMITELRSTGLETKLKAVKEISEIKRGDHLRLLVEQGVIAPLCQLLNPHITPARSDILSHALRAISNIFVEGEGETPNRYFKRLNESGALQLIEQLQNNSSMDVYHRAVQILAMFPNRGRGEMFPDRERKPVTPDEEDAL